jgi:hypothetical protein
MALPNTDPFSVRPPLPHEQLRIKVTERRRRYLTLGYEPIPIISGRKRPALDDWRKTKLDLDTVSAWANDRPAELSTGIRTKYTPGFDIDIRNADIADKVQQALFNMLPSGTFLKRTGLPPKRLIPCRCTTPFSKIGVSFKSPDGTVHKVEVLGDGQQFVAEGIHEDTKLPYHWEDNTDLLTIAHEHLPLVDEALARRFVTEASAIMERAGWERVDVQGRTKNKTSTKTKTNGKTKPKINDSYYHFALKDECEALAAMRADSGRNNALNVAALKLFQLVEGGGLDENEVREQLFAAAEKCGLVADDGEKSVLATIDSGAKKGREEPRRAPERNSSDDQVNDQHGDEDDELVTNEAAAMEMCGVEWLWPGRFARGKFGLIAGLPDYGKGQIAAFITAAVTAGIELPCDEGTATQGNVLWFNAEDSARDTILPRLVAP